MVDARPRHHGRSFWVESPGLHSASDPIIVDSTWPASQTHPLRRCPICRRSPMWWSRTLPRPASSVILVLLLAAIAQPADFFAAPDGSSNGDGSIGHPWSLKKALSFPPAV